MQLEKRSRRGRGHGVPSEKSMKPTKKIKEVSWEAQGGGQKAGGGERV